VTHAAPLTAFRNTNAAIEVDRAPRVLRRTDLAIDAKPVAASDLSFRIHTDLSSIEDVWRRFEATADSTPFQTFEWLAAWQRHVGARSNIEPVVVVGSHADGSTAFIFPFGIEEHRAIRRLCWFGQDLCDYNAPLLAPDFSERVSRERFLALWKDLRAQMQSDPRLRHDWIEFEKMPQIVGTQINPFTYLRVAPNANSAHIAQLSTDWESFYRDKRSSATRRHDRSKRKRMAKFGDVRFSTMMNADDIRQTLDVLWDQKKQIFARKGISDIFSRPGYREFFLDFATNAASKRFVHVSRVDVGATCAAANFGIVFGDCYYHVLSSYCDGRIAHYGPGALHLRDLMSYAIERGLRRFDFTIGDELYKSEWCDVLLHLCDFSTAATLRGVPASTASQSWRRLKRFIKQTPVIWRLVTQLRVAYGTLKSPRQK
jgi:CelD/BcsL family acetyltransferase involved in cellulose biosynthesis